MNTNMLKDQVYNKMKDLTFHTIVNKAFINAIPIDKSEITKENALAISTYSLNALESAGGFKLLEDALENTTDIFKHGFLEDIYDICTESAMEVATRVAMEAEDLSVEVTDEKPEGFGETNTDSNAGDSGDTNDDGAMPQLADNKVDDKAGIDDVDAPDDTENVPTKPEVIRQGKPFKDLVADAKMTDKEYGRFVDRLGKLDLPEVSRLINDRVETAMKAEKETYRMVSETDQKLKDAITDKAEEDGDTLTDAQAEEIKESVLAVPLKGMQREHVSLFSTIQAAAIESVHLHGVTDMDEVDPNILLSVTENYTFDDIFDNEDMTLEQLLDAALNYTQSTAACESVGTSEQMMVLGTAFATIVYTLLQTLYSMNLIQITPGMVKTCCDRGGPICKYPHGFVDRYNCKLRAALENNEKDIRKIRYAEDADTMTERLNSLRGKVYTARDKGFPVRDDIEEAIETAINHAVEKRDELLRALESTLTVERGTPTSMRLNEVDKCSINNVCRTFRTTPIDTIEFKCTEGTNFVDILGISNGRNIKNTSMVIESAIDVPTDKYLKALISESNLTKLSYGNNKPSLVINNDGRRTTIRV